MTRVVILPLKRMALKEFIEQNHLKPVLLLNTHCHLDHIFGNRFVQKTYGLALHISRAKAVSRLWACIGTNVADAF